MTKKLFAVPVFKIIRGMAIIEADSAREAGQIAKGGPQPNIAHLIGADTNSVIDWDGVRKRKIRELKGDDLKAYELHCNHCYIDNIFDNDNGVPYEDYEPADRMKRQR